MISSVLPWWNAFHADVDRHGGKSSDTLAGGKFAIVTGLMGLDNGHASMWAEIHPVWCLAMLVDQTDSDETWAMFARNWGDEGSCSHYQHYLSLSANRYTFRLPWRAGARTVDDLSAPSDFHRSGQGVAGPTLKRMPGLQVLVSFTLPPPEQQAFINGALHLRWH